MKTITARLPIFAAIVATRAALAFGLGLLVAGKIPERRRRQIGIALVAIGATTTIPAVRFVRAQLRES
jgi:hypothetical protein